MRVAIAVLVAAATACRPQAPKANVDPVTDAEARTFVPVLLAAIQPRCDQDKLGASIDHDALGARFAEHSKLDADKRDRAAAATASNHSGTKVLCSWFSVGSTVGYKLMSVDAEHRPLVRRIAIAEGAKASAVSYYRFALGKSRSDGIVRIVDAYAFTEGEWLASSLAEVADASLANGPDGAFKLTAVMKQIGELRAKHDPAQALKLVETLPPELQHVHSVRLIRATIANEIGHSELIREVDALAAAYPDDISTALLGIDAAVFANDYPRAMHYIDIVDQAVGGDPFQNALRATLTFQQHDIAAAARYADAAITAEPTLVRAQLAKLDIEVAQKDWPAAIATIKTLDTLGQHLIDAKLRAIPAFAELLASDEYRAWRPSTTP